MKTIMAGFNRLEFMKFSVALLLIVAILLMVKFDWLGEPSAAQVAQQCGSAGIGWRVASQFNSDYPVGETVTADFNGDGKLDLAISETSQTGTGGGISIVLGDGRGYFETLRRTEFQGAMRNLIVSDFNRDGKLDIFFSGSQPNTFGYIGLLVGNGDGTFGVRQVAGFSSFVTGIAVDDFSGDGRIDVAVVLGQPNNSLYIVAGNVAGGFTVPRQPINLNGIPMGFTTADFNKDNKPDLLMAFSPVGILKVLTNNGSGTFSETAGPALRNSLRRLYTDDLNGDGNTDLIVSEFGLLEIFVGDGRAGFVQPKQFDYSNVSGIAVRDFSGDGKADLAVLNGSASLLVSDGMGGFIPSGNFAAGRATFSLVAGDFNGDGKQDLAASDTQQKAISFLFNSGATNFAASQVSGSFQFATSIRTSDLNKDGRPDLFAYGQSFSGVSVAIGDGKGGFGVQTNYGSSVNINNSVSAAAVADFDKDGNSDLVAVHGDGFSSPLPVMTLLTGEVSGNFSAARSRKFSLTAFASELVTSDFNGDGWLDLAMANSGTNNLSVMLNDKRGGFVARQDIQAGLEPWSLVVADFNGDGKSDLAVANRNSVTLTVLLGNGDGQFNSVLIGIGANPRMVRTGDFNGDGKIDLLVPHNNNEAISVLLGNGNGGFLPPLTNLLGAFVQSLVVGDFNRDGKLDFAMTVTQQNVAQNNVRIFNGDGTGKFLAASQVFAPSAADLQLADLNMDGLIDLLTIATIENFGASVWTILGQCNQASNVLVNASAASYRRLNLAPESVVAAFGPGLSNEIVVASGLPLPTQLGGTSVTVKDSAGIERLAPLFFVSPNQVNYLMPRGSAAGAASITINNVGNSAKTTSLIAPVAPGLFAANSNGQGVAAAVVLRIKPDGRQLYEPIARFDSTLNQFVAEPINLTSPPFGSLDQVFLVLFGTGIRGRRSLDEVEVFVGMSNVGAVFAGAQGELAGLDQINIQLSGRLITTGDLDVAVSMDGRQANVVKINIR